RRVNNPRLAQTTGLARIRCQFSRGCHSISRTRKAAPVTISEIVVEMGIVKPTRNAPTTRNRARRAALSNAVSLGDEEETAEREQGLAPGIGRIGLDDEGAIGRLEFGALGCLERFEKRAERRSLGPFGHRIGPLEDLKISGFPDIEAAGTGCQHGVVLRGLRYGGWAQQGTQALSPGPCLDGSCNRTMGRLVVVVGHLHGKLPAWCRLTDEPAEQRRMIVQPVEGSVAEKKV